MWLNKKNNYKMGRIRQVAWLQPRDMGEPRWKHTWIPKSKFIWERKGKERKRKTKERKKRKGDPALSGKVKILEKRECVNCEDEEETSLWQVATHQPLILAIQIFKNTSFSGRIFIFFPTDVLSPSLPPS